MVKGIDKSRVVYFLRCLMNRFFFYFFLVLWVIIFEGLNVWILMMENVGFVDVCLRYKFFDLFMEFVIIIVVDNWGDYLFSFYNLVIIILNCCFFLIVFFGV